MEKVVVKVEWCNKNFCAVVGDNVPGAIVVASDTMDHLKKDVVESIEFHVEGMVADGDEVPAWLASGDYALEWSLGVSALIRACEPLVSIAAISRATGINQRLLSHYANGIKTPRSAQREKIVNGIRSIGRQLISVV